MLKRFSYLYEAPLFFLLLFGVNRVFFPQLPGFVGMDPHPYWIGILLFGFRYGVPAGLLAGVLASALYFYFAWNFLERYLFEDISFYLLPSFFILVGVLVGVGVRHYRETLDRLTRDKEELTRVEKALRDEIKTLKEINIGLEKRIATRMTTLVTLYEGARRLETIQLEDLYPAILEFITKTLDVEKSSLYLKVEGCFVLKKSIGWQDYERRPAEIPMNEGIIGIAGASKKVTSIRDFLQGPSASAPSLLGDAMLAGPLRDGENGEVVGVLSIQEMSFLSFNSATLNLFAFLLQWASRSIGRANYISRLKEQEIVDPEYHVYSKNYFFSRASQELIRSKTYYLP
ncbi:MAG: GAF domain-containing protein, partial [bacterium]|nr:GAF domain-containing protein [bacterium]